MAISFVDAVGASATSVTRPTSLASDFLIQQVFRNGSATAPGAPSTTGAINFANAGANTCAKRVTGKFATGTTDGIAASTNGTQTTQMVFRGVRGFGPISAGSGSSSTLSYTTISPIGGGNGWIIAFGSHRTASDLSGGPTGLTNRSAGNIGSGPQSCPFDSNAGSSSWSTQTDGVNASSGWLTTVIELLPYSTWNPYVKDASITLSSDQKTATATAATAANVQGSFPRGTGKYYFEVTVGETAGSGAGSVGVCEVNYATNNFVQASLSYSGNVFINGSNVGSVAALTPGDVVGVAVDKPNNTIQWRINGGSLSSTFDISALTNSVVPCCGDNFSGPTYLYDGVPGSPPTGFDPWDGSTVTSHPSSGALIGQGATLSGSAAHKKIHGASGVLTGPGSAVVGSAAHIAKHATSGALTGQGAVLAGTARRFRAHGTSGTLTGPGASLAGTAVHLRPHATSGALVGPGAALSGTARRFRAHGTSGVLTGQGAVVVGSADHAAGGGPVTHAASGSLVGSGSVIAGAAALRRLHVASGVLAGQGSLIAGIAQLTSLHFWRPVSPNTGSWSENTENEKTWTEQTPGASPWTEQ